MNEITFLEENAIFNQDGSVLQNFNNGESQAAITDFAIILGGLVTNNYYTNAGQALENRTGVYWTKTADGDNDARCVY